MLAPAVTLATVGVLITAALTAPVAKFVLGIGWIQALLVGAVVASTDAAAVFFLIHARGLRLRPRVRAALEVESGTNDPFAIFLTLLLVEILLVGNQSWSHALVTLLRDAVLGCVIGFAGGRIIALVLNRLALPQGLHAPFVATSALVVFAFANAVHASGFLAVYLAGLVVGNRQTRAHNSVIVFLDAATWLAQIAMFVLLGLLAWPERLPTALFGARRGAGADADRAAGRGVPVPCAVPFQCARSCSSPGSACAARSASFSPRSRCWSDCRRAIYFSTSPSWWCCCRCWCRAGPWRSRPASSTLSFARSRSDAAPHRARSARPADARDGRLSGAANSPFLRRGLDSDLGPADAGGAQRGNSDAGGGRTRSRGRPCLFAGAAGKGAGARPLLRRDAAAGVARPRLLGDFFVPGTATLGALAEIYGLQVAADHTEVTLADYFGEQLRRRAKTGDIVELGPVALLAHTVDNGLVTTVGLQLAEPEEATVRPGRPRRRRCGSWIRNYLG